MKISFGDGIEFHLLINVSCRHSEVEFHLLSNVLCTKCVSLKPQFRLIHIFCMEHMRLELFGFTFWSWSGWWHNKFQLFLKSYYLLLLLLLFLFLFWLVSTYFKRQLIWKMNGSKGAPTNSFNAYNSLNFQTMWIIIDF